METKIERTYHGNGKPQSELPHVGGKLHGLMKWWWQDGQLSSEQPYVGGKLHGMAKHWRRNGDISVFRLYNQGEYVARFYPKNETHKWKLK
jgi:antitoxin component YwqK of YwqJK toxin-antitoxin module